MYAYAHLECTEYDPVLSKSERKFTFLLATIYMFATAPFSRIKTYSSLSWSSLWYGMSLRKKNKKG
jgi:hypothetical protein